MLNNYIELNETDLVIVCDECLQASCWLGEFMCEESRDAGTTEKSVKELRKLGYEHSDYWKRSLKC